MKLILHGTKAGLERLKAIGPEKLSKEIGMEVTSIEEEKTYRVVRKYKDDSHPDNNKEIATGLTRAEAKEHCSDPDTEEKGVWFDCFYEE